MRPVLIVEDQPAVASALSVLFNLHDIPTIVAANPDSAARAVQRGGAVGLVLQDMNFAPGATGGDEGIALFRRIRALDPELPILLMTAWTSLETAVQLVKEGATDYLAKPWNDAKLVATVRALLEVSDRRAKPGDVVQESDAMQRVVSMATRIAPSDIPVLITGPNGSGKEKIAEIIHGASRRAAKPLVRVNAGAIPDELMESELFGAEAGAYTGAIRLRIGRFEAADHGTLFLDEIGNLTAAGQKKLLRVLQTGEFERLGSSETRKVDVRVLCATNVDLHEAIALGEFRQDLFFRIAVLEIVVPPLRQRREDVLPLTEQFLGSDGRSLDEEAKTALLAYSWPGNVRELQNRVQRAQALAVGPAITAEDLGFGAADGDPSDTSANLPERARIEAALRSADGSVSRAAASLGVSRQALYRTMDRLGIVLERRPK
jgi:DNA-binding NtrC family response regulator